MKLSVEYYEHHSSLSCEPVKYIEIVEVNEKNYEEAIAKIMREKHRENKTVIAINVMSEFKDL